MAGPRERIAPSLATPLGRTRAKVRAAIMVERLWPLLLPAILVLGLFLTFSWFGLFRLMPDWLRLGSAGLFAIAFIAALALLTRYRRPAPSEIDRRIERANALAHAPVTTQDDRIAGAAGTGDSFAAALWREHQRRMAEKLDGLAGDLPRTRIPERDPWGMRAVVALLLVVAFAFSYGPRGGSISDVLRGPKAAEAVPPRIDAWVTPPAYTGRAPLYLTSDANRGQNLFAVPAGSDFAVRITGGSGTETLAIMDEGGTTPVAPEGSAEAQAATGNGAPAPQAVANAAQNTGARQFAGKLGRDGVLSLKRDEATLQSWTFQVTPDNAPVIRFTEAPRRAVNGTLELRYEVEDDYGAVAGTTIFAQEQADAPGARPLYKAPEMPLTLPRRNGRDIAARTSRDLTEHAWAGSQVDVTLEATDAAGQAARSETKRITLPQRPFSNPLARALIEQRRMLALDANSKARVLRLMDAVMLRPEDTIPNSSHFLGISTAETRLRAAESDEALRGVVDYLWEVALGIENGNLSGAQQRLQQAQEALKEALENGASNEEIERLMQELRQAMNEFMREFAEQAMRNPDMQQQPQNGQEMRQSDLNRMMDQMEEMAKSGARDQAREMLSQLQDMMNNLQMARPQQGQQGQGQQSEARRQMDQLGEMMRRQQELMNETFQMDQMQRGQQQRGRDRSQQRGQQGQQGQQGQRGQQGQQGQQGERGQQGQGGQQPMSPEEFAEALRQLQQRQQQLQQQLREFAEGMRGQGMEPGEGFGEAGEAMGEAGNELGQQNGQGAVGEQGRALEAMRRGAQDMMQQMQQAQQGEQGQEGGSEQGGRQRASDRDPLGRPRATTGPDFGNSVEVPDEIDTQRARQILEEIRRRLGNALSPQLEREYLERLLRMQ